MTLLELCYNKPDLILLDSTDNLVRAHLKHYNQLTPEQIRYRLLNLFQSLVRCLEGDSCENMLKFMKIVSDERYESGYELSEVQTAINILEECMWRKISKFVDGDKQINAMKQVTNVLCKAKEELVSEYALLSTEYIYN
ncbi:MAG TPA: hypothetical protein VGK25_01095 [Ignavibacteria bacterium]|jgi:hypothetical protein